MSQRAVERVIGKLVTDEGFRDQFFENADVASLRIGVDLSREEKDSLLRIPSHALAELAARLDDRICKLHIKSVPLGQEYRQ